MMQMSGMKRVWTTAVVIIVGVVVVVVIMVTGRRGWRRYVGK